MVRKCVSTVYLSSEGKSSFHTCIYVVEKISCNARNDEYPTCCNLLRSVSTRLFCHYQGCYSIITFHPTSYSFGLFGILVKSKSGKFSFNFSAMISAQTYCGQSNLPDITKCIFPLFFLSFVITTLIQNKSHFLIFFCLSYHTKKKRRNFPPFRLFRGGKKKLPCALKVRLRRDAPSLFFF